MHFAFPGLGTVLFLPAAEGVDSMHDLGFLKQRAQDAKGKLRRLMTLVSGRGMRTEIRIILENWQHCPGHTSF